uniref:Uncharacterized protein n=1 Tax=Cannabis sativa TaxID=3483 RepID=A0A803NIF3_CANSA
MVKTRSSLSPSDFSKLLLDKKKMKKTISEDDNEDLSGGSDDSGDVLLIKEVKRKQYNRGNKKVTDDQPLKKLKQAVEYDEDLYDSDDLEVENNESMKACVLFLFIFHFHFSVFFFCDFLN